MQSTKQLVRLGVPSLVLELLVHTSKFETLMKKYEEPFGIYTNSSLWAAHYSVRSSALHWLRRN